MASDHPEPGPDSGPDSVPDTVPDAGLQPGTEPSSDAGAVTGPVEGSVPDPPSEPQSGPDRPVGVPRADQSGPGLDVDAVFADIVAHWEPSAPESDQAAPALVSERDPAPYPDPGHRLLADPVEDDHEDHFVPPPPPPLPTVEPRRKLAWTALVGAPVLALLLIALGVVVPGWVALGMVVAFVGGFGYLVATMSSSSPQDPWSGDDGAII